MDDEILTEDGGGKREHFYPRYELIERELIDRIAKVMTQGAAKYGEYNWRKFNEEQVKDIPRHAFKHMVDYMHGDQSEDHLANAACNIMMAMWFEENSKLQPR